MSNSIEQLIAERDALKASLTAEKVVSAFNRSRFVADRLTVPPDIAAARFGASFGIENGVVVGKDAAGNRIMSRDRLGEAADFDEALEILVAGYPHRESILKRAAASSGDAPNLWDKKTMPRAQFDRLDLTARHAAVKQFTIVD